MRTNLTTTRFRIARRIEGIQPSIIRSFFDRGVGCVNLGMGEPDFFSPEVIRRRAIEVLRSEKLPYTPNLGSAELREKVASLYPGATAENILITAGSQEALFSVIFAFVDREDKVLVSNPAFVAYPTLVRMAGATQLPYQMPAPRFKLETDGLDTSCSQARLMLLNSPSNPTGQNLSREDLVFLDGCASKSDCLLVSDEIYREVYFDTRPLSLWDITHDHLVISGFSKTYSMTGWRLGWIVGPVEAVKKINLIHAYAVTCASTLSQRAALAVFTPEGEAERENLRLELKLRKNLMAELLQAKVRLPFLEPQGSFYFLLDVSALGNSIEVAERLLRAGVITIPAAPFGTNCEGYLRLSCSGSLEDIEKGVDIIGRTLASRE